MNNISLSKEEDKAVRQLILELENRSRRWPWVRWIGIMVSIIVLFSSILLGKDVQQMLGETLPKLELSADNFDPKYVKSYIDYSISRYQAEEHFETAQAIAFFGSFLFLVFFFADRNRGARAGLLAKLLRQTLDKDSQPENQRRADGVKGP